MLKVADINIENADQLKAAVKLRDSLLTPVGFIETTTGDKLWSKQSEIVNAIEMYNKVSVRSCHGVGKTHIGSRIAAEFLNRHRDSVVITTAPTWRQVEEQMWRYMNSLFNRSKQAIELPGRMLTTKYEIGDDWFAIGVSSNDTDKIQGFHSASGDILVIVDEAAGVSEATFTAIEAIMVSDNAKLLLLGNPTSVSGTFRSSHHDDPTFHKIAISCFDTPNFINNGIETIDDLREVNLKNVEITHPYLITPAWAKDKITRWGVESPDFQSRVLGNFPSAEANTIIPVNLIEAAMTPERLVQLTVGGHLDQPHRIGSDIARYGDDETTIYGGRGGVLQTENVAKGQDTMVTANKIMDMPASLITALDVDGVGGGVYDRLSQMKLPNIYGIHNGSSPIKDATGIRFANLKAQLWYYASTQFKMGNVYIPPEMDVLASQLASVRFNITNRGWTVEGKDDTKKRLHRSPDRAEGYIYWLGSQLLESNAGASFHIGRARKNSKK